MLYSKNRILPEHAASFTKTLVSHASLAHEVSLLYDDLLMSSPNNLYGSVEYGGTAAADLIEATAELAGTWPPNVTIRSVLFWHGPALYGDENFIRAGMRNWERLGDALQGVDTVGIEIVSAENMDTIEIEEAFADIESRSILEHSLFGLIMGVAQAGAGRIPHLFPIDVYDAPNLQKDAVRSMSDQTLSWRQRVELSAEVDPAREAHVIRQVHRLATQLDDGQPHTIAIVQGALHFPTALAMQALGASVEQVAIDAPSNSPAAQAEMAIRQHMDIVELEPLIEHCEEAALFAEAIRIFGRAERLLRSRDGFDRQMETEAVSDIIGARYIAWLDRALPAHLDRLFMAVADALVYKDDLTGPATALLDALFAEGAI